MELIKKSSQVDIYLHEGKVIKVYPDGITDAFIQYEYKLHEVSKKFGSEKIYGIEKENHIAFEYVKGESMLKRLLAHTSRVQSMAKIFAGLQEKIHVEDGGGLVDQKFFFSKKIMASKHLSPDVKNELIDRLNDLENKGALCHGDFDLDNIIYVDHYRVINWDNAYRGHPLSDVALTWLKLSLKREKLSKGYMNLFRFLYLRYYLSITGSTNKAFKSWLSIAAAASIDEVKAEDRPYLLSIIFRDVKKVNLFK
ncbi:hypothetical protein EZV73_11085 [Acidaminobacter sp. JC074]|uniref:phosphotransferase n=1 Tax=Acidaminobacter sp. JC074 TaxID=2530199 RepID=UPI001F0FCA75|nr:phosphotransferase [Acidaminobacter sp. JC074]MCH4888120.1 hypothetical protein [Acidaminobacter sp. JC074]